METRDNPLAGVWAKIERAEKHIEEFDKARKIFVDSHPYRFTYNVNPDTGYYDISVLDVRPIPLEIPVIIGDVIHNLRSAMDLLACQLVRLRSFSHDCKNVYFPIADSAQIYLRVLERREIKEMGPTAVNILRDLQTYKGGRSESLWQIHELSIRDKHRFLIVAGAGLKSWLARYINTHIFPMSTESPYIISGTIPGDDVIIFKEGDKILSIDPAVLAPNPGDAVKVDLKFPRTITFNEPQVIESKPDLDSLQGFVKVVKETVESFISLFPKQ